MDASEQLIADTLSKHAGDAPSDDHLLAAVHTRRLRRRRSGRAVGAVVLAAAAVATALTASQDRATPQIAQDPAPGWRWESYKTVEVQVPDRWNQYISGAAPCLGPGDSGPAVGRLNDWLGNRRLPCVVAVMPLAERKDYLWFNDVQAPGIKRYDGGWTEETRLVGGVKLSVLTQDDALRERILDSVRPITQTDYYGCTPRDPGDQPGKLGEDAVTSVEVCEYFDGSLVAGSRLTGKPAAELARGLTGRPTTGTMEPATGCQDPDPRIFVITVHTRTTAWPVRIAYTTCRPHQALDDLIRQGPHRQSQPSDIILVPPGSTPSPR
jgi:hypothetical protein